MLLIFSDRFSLLQAGDDASLRRSVRQACKERKVWSKRQLTTTSLTKEEKLDVSPDCDRRKRKAVSNSSLGRQGVKRKLGRPSNKERLAKKLKAEEEKNAASDASDANERPKRAVKTEFQASDVTEEEEEVEDAKWTLEEHSESSDSHIPKKEDISSDDEVKLKDEQQIFTLNSSHLNSIADMKTSDSQCSFENNVSLTSQIIRESLQDSSILTKSITPFRCQNSHISSPGELSSRARSIFNKSNSGKIRRNSLLPKCKFATRMPLSSKSVKAKRKDWKDILSSRHARVAHRTPGEPSKESPEPSSFDGRNGKASEKMKFCGDEKEDAASSLLRKFRLQDNGKKCNKKISLVSKTPSEVKSTFAPTFSTSTVSSLKTLSSVASAELNKNSTEILPKKSSLAAKFDEPVDHIPELPIATTISKLKARVNQSKSNLFSSLEESVASKKLPANSSSNSDEDFKNPETNEVTQLPQLENLSKIPPKKLNLNLSAEECKKATVNTNSPSAQKEYAKPVSSEVIKQPSCLILSSPLSPEVLEDGKVSLKAALAQLLDAEEQAGIDSSQQTLTIHSATKNECDNGQKLEIFKGPDTPEEMSVTPPDCSVNKKVGEASSGKNEDTEAAVDKSERLYHFITLGSF